MATIFDVVIAGSLIVGGYFILTSGALDNIGGGNTVEATGGGDVVGGDTTGEIIGEETTEDPIKEGKIDSNIKVSSGDTVGGTTTKISNTGSSKCVKLSDKCVICPNKYIYWVDTCNGKRVIVTANMAKSMSTSVSKACSIVANEFKRKCTGSTTGGNTSTGSCPCKNKPSCGNVGGFQTCKLCCCKDACQKLGYKTGPIGSINSKGACICGTCSERCKKLGKGYTGGSIKNGSCICSKPTYGGCGCKYSDCNKVGGTQSCKSCCCSRTCKASKYSGGKIQSNGKCICGTCTERCKRLGKGYTSGSIKNGSCICSKSSSSGSSTRCPYSGCTGLNKGSTCFRCRCAKICSSKGGIKTVKSDGSCYCNRSSAAFIQPSTSIAGAVQVQAYRYSNDYNIPYAYMTKTSNAVMDSPIAGMGA